MHKLFIYIYNYDIYIYIYIYIYIKSFGFYIVKIGKLFHLAPNLNILRIKRESLLEYSAAIFYSI